METEQILENLATAVIDGDDEMASENAKAALANNMDPLEAVEQGLSKGMDVIGSRFETGEVFLPELLMAASAFKAAMEILKPELEAQKKATVKQGTVLLGTVKGDLHNIGKNIVATVLETNGFDVVDIGINNSPLTFIEQAENAQVDIIGLSCLMTTTMPAQREVIQTLDEMNLRDKYQVIVGGGPVTQEWADQIGADGYSESAVQAVNLVKDLMKRG
ncbi:MAG: corrinoid protein [Anaerolineales bacterium]|jgi:corrinoid protein of di/trimethylamine methyltransferase|nr:corrinoid protein [Anaerolineales bacterium]